MLGIRLFVAVAGITGAMRPAMAVIVRIAACRTAPDPFTLRHVSDILASRRTVLAMAAAVTGTVAVAGLGIAAAAPVVKRGIDNATELFKASLDEATD